MKIAIPIWNGKVSSVFDFARRMVVIELDDGRETARREIVLESEDITRRTAELQRAEIDVLICGAVSRPLANIIRSCGMEVIPFVTGSVDQILDAYLKGQLNQQQFMMPGCWQGARKRQRRRCRKRTGRKGKGRGQNFNI